MIAVIGCGNPNRSDDGVGPAVIRVLEAQSALADDPDLRLLDAGTDGMAVMFAARGCQTLILVDCCRSGAEPGTLFEAPGDALAATHEPGYSLHDFRWDHAIHAGKTMYRDAFPSDVTVILVEARSTDLGVDLSSEVRVAVDQVAQRVVEIVRERRS